MRIDVYVSKRNKSKFVSVPANTDVNAHNLGSVDPELSQLSPFNTIEITRGKHTIALNADEILSDIEKNGFAVHQASAKSSA